MNLRTGLAVATVALVAVFGAPRLSRADPEHGGVWVTSADRRALWVPVPGGPGSRSGAWGVNATLAEVLQSQGACRVADITPDGKRARSVWFGPSQVCLDETGRVDHWHRSTGLALRRAGRVTWTAQALYSGTAADVMDLLGTPTLTSATLPRVWEYGKSRIGFGLAGEVTGISDQGELGWTRTTSGYDLRGAATGAPASSPRPAAPTTAPPSVRPAPDPSPAPDPVLRALQAFADGLRRGAEAAAKPSAAASAPSKGVVELFAVSGFDKCSGGLGSASACYLSQSAVPCLGAALRQAGFVVREHEYGNSEIDYARLVSDLRMLGGTPGLQRSKVILAAHSQGGVWAHAATRAVPTSTIDIEIDLDTTSYGWALRRTPSIGDPRNAYVERRTGARYDLEDVVFPNVALDLEVRSGEYAIGGFSRELYDEQANLALAGSTRITTWIVGTTHAEVHQGDGATMRRVATWVAAHL